MEPITPHVFAGQARAVLPALFARAQNPIHHTYGAPLIATLQEQNKAISRRWREEVDNGNWGVIDELIRPNFVMHLPGSPPMNLESVQHMLKMFDGAFPDLHHSCEDLVAEGGEVALRFTLHGTHRGTFQGLPPTGKTVKISASVVDRIVDGQVVEHWSLMDTMGMMQRLGVIPMPEES